MLELPTFFRKEIILEFWLEKVSVVTVIIYDEAENELDSIIEHQHFKEGNQKIKITKTKLKKGKYWAKIYIKNHHDHFYEAIKFVVP